MALRPLIDLTADELVVAGAQALVREESTGLCAYGRVCDLCDCFSDLDGGADRDQRARNHARAVLAAAGWTLTHMDRST